MFPQQLGRGDSEPLGDIVIDGLERIIESEMSIVNVVDLTETFGVGRRRPY